MPRIKENILDSVVHLYDSEEDAKQGNSTGVRVFYLLFCSKMKESFVMDGRSIMGLSGSPLYYVVLTPEETKTLFLLGTVWGHGSVPERMYRWNGLDTGTVVRVNTGLLHAIPAWRLKMLLDEEEPKMRRDEIERQAKEDAEKNIGKPSAELDVLHVQDVVEKPSLGDEGYETREDFLDVLDRVIRPIKSSDQEKSETSG